MDTAQFRAVSGEKEGLGATPQEALDALIAGLPSDFGTPIVILPFNRGDVFFTQAQQDRLLELKTRQSLLTDAEDQELDNLIEAAFNASVARMQSVQPVKM